jgi:hypothetical protein
VLVGFRVCRWLAFGVVVVCSCLFLGCLLPPAHVGSVAEGTEDSWLFLFCPGRVRFNRLGVLVVLDVTHLVRASPFVHAIKIK